MLRSFFLTTAMLCCLPKAPLRAQPTRAQAYTDTLRALVVFVRFSDDTNPGAPSLDYRGWPLREDGEVEPVPAFAPALLARDPAPPYPDSSLTAYFAVQSGGRFLLFGDVYPDVVVSERPEDHYHRPDGGLGHLTQEVLDRLDEGGVDFGRYDFNRDGKLDHLFLILRGSRRRDAKQYVWTGISCLDARCGGGVAGGGPRGALRYDGIRVDWNTSGSILLHRTPGNILPHYYLVRLMAHELGHDLWARFFVHIPALTDNDVPAQSNRGRTCLGYALMAGAGGGMDCRGDETISAFERDLLGWIDCRELTSDRTGVRLRDLYTSSDCYLRRLGGSSAGRVLYLTNRQRIGPFDRYRRGGNDGRFEMGLLRTTGLLATLVRGTRYDVLPADNTLDLDAANAPYDGDLFGPGTSSQLTPWTRPGINGFTNYPEGYEPDWSAIDNIAYTGDDDREMSFDYIRDFRENPVIRADSWIGEETRGYTFEAPFRVANGSTLHLGTALHFGDSLVVERGATVRLSREADVTLQRGAVLYLRAGSTLVLEGTLTLDGLVALSPGAVIIRRGGAFRVSL